MRTITELRRLKRSYTKEYPEKALIINLNNYPDIDIVITDGHGRSWASFLNNPNTSDFIDLGVNDAQIKSITNISFPYINNLPNTIISDNKEIKRVFSKALEECYFLQDLRKILTINPKLYTNIHDVAGTRFSKICFNGRLMIGPLQYIPNKSADNIKDAYCKCSLSIISKVYEYTGYPDRKLFEILHNNNYSMTDTINVLKARYNYYASVRFLGDRQILNYYKTITNEFSANSLNVASIYNDYLALRESLLEANYIESAPKTPKIDKLKEWHDKLFNIYNRYLKELEILKDKQRNDKYIAQFYPKAKEFEFKNDEYSIIACPNVSDLITEGSELHHCVGSYINSVSNGNEYILFLRKNNELDKPYFTIDVTPDKNVRQIHGFDNCNLTKELKPFVKEWADKFKLDISHCSGVLCALH